MTHPEAQRQARALVTAHDGSARDMVEDELGQRIAHGDLNEALRLDQVRREITKVYVVEGE